jgi:hypothetical protein
MAATCSERIERLVEDRHMSLFVAQWIARASVMVPVIIAVTAAVWLALNVAGLLKRGVPLDVADMRTWPLQFALGEAAIFAIIFSGIAAWAGDNPGLVAAASGVAACLAIGVAHVLGWRKRSG